MLKRTVLPVAAILSLVALVLGIEIALAVNRRYVSSTPPLELDGSFGPAGGDPLRFVVLGDSTAAGVGAGRASDAFPTLLAERLAARGRRVELRVLAVSGARVRDVLVDQLPRVRAFRPSLVFIAIGGNDATHVTRLDDVRRDFEAILDEAATLDAALVVAGPADMRTHNFLPPLRQIAGWRGRRVEQEIGEAAVERGVRVVPLRERTGHLFAEDPDTYYSEDRFHPGPAGYAGWADAIYPELEGELTGR